MIKCQNRQFLRYSAASVRKKKKPVLKNTMFRTCFLENSYEKEPQKNNNKLKSHQKPVSYQMQTSKMVLGSGSHARSCQLRKQLRIP